MKVLVGQETFWDTTDENMTCKNITQNSKMGRHAKRMIATFDYI